MRCFAGVALAAVLSSAGVASLAACARIDFGPADGGGAGGSGGAAGAGPVAGGGGAGGGEGGSGPEDCSNGRDDDGDELVDCEDASCRDFVCIEAPPFFEGPFALASLGLCDPAYSESLLDGQSDLVVPKGKCDCTCGNPTPVTCGQATLQMFEDIACAGLAAQAPVTSACTAVGGGPSIVTIRAFAPAPSGGLCTPTLTANLPPPTVGSLGVCSAPRLGGGCGAGVCAPLPEGDRLCVLAEGDEVECPSPWEERLVLYEAGLLDTRSCDEDACTCTSTSSCATTIDVYSGNACTFPEGSATPGSGCTAISPGGVATARAVIAPLDVGCAPSSVEPSGSVTGLVPFTLCCSKLEAFR